MSLDNNYLLSFSLLLCALVVSPYRNPNVIFLWFVFRQMHQATITANVILRCRTILPKINLVGLTLLHLHDRAKFNFRFLHFTRPKNHAQDMQYQPRRMRRKVFWRHLGHFPIAPSFMSRTFFSSSLGTQPFRQTVRLPPHATYTLHASEDSLPGLDKLPHAHSKTLQ